MNTPRFTPELPLFPLGCGTYWLYLTYSSLKHQKPRAANWKLMPYEGGGGTCQQNVNVVPHYCCAVRKWPMK